MKRSEINRILTDAKNFMAEKCFYPPTMGLLDNCRLERESDLNLRNSEQFFWDGTSPILDRLTLKNADYFSLRSEMEKLGLIKNLMPKKIMIVEEDQETPHALSLVKNGRYHQSRRRKSGD